MNDPIPLAVLSLTGNEREYVQDAIASGYVAAGPYVERFEQAMCARLGVRYAVAVSSGTAALHLSLLAAGVGPGDEVLVSDLTFIAPVNAIRYVGATPVLIDAEPEYWQMDTEKAFDYWRGLRFARRNLQAIIPVHVLGHPVEMGTFRALMRHQQATIVEDATEALGATWEGRKVGTIGDMACLSFNGNKIITAGGGGMVVTDREDLAEQVRYLANQAKGDPVEYVHGAIGYNYRLSNLQAAVGCAQLERLDEHLAAKRRIAETYTRELAGVPGIAPMKEAAWAKSSWWLYTIRVMEPEYGITRPVLRVELAVKGIESRPLWRPAHMQVMYRQLGGSFPVAERLYRECLSLPCSVGLTEGQQARVIDAVKGLRGG